MSILRETIREFGQYYQTNMMQELPDLEPERKDQLRVSGFPYCGLRHFYKKINAHNEKRVRGFGSQFYTGVGTLTHEVVQEYLGQGHQIYGVWKCQTSGCGGMREFSKLSRCPKCSATMKYEEFTVKAFTHISGHLDGLYKAKSGHWFVPDYKTSSAKTIEGQKYTKSLPYAYNVAQIRAYCSLIELEWDIEISGWLLHYLARDSPATVHFTTGGLVTRKSKRLELEKMEKWDRHYGIVTSRPESLKDIRVIVEEKPCATQTQYEKEYKTFDACPLSNGGVCFNAKKLDEVLKLSWDDYKNSAKTVK